MELVDRYIYAVKRHLPAAQQEDIANELTDDILSRVKEKEAELGRPLTDDEQGAVLKHYGHPYLFAVRYRPQQHLIGPTAFPFYWPVLKWALAMGFAVNVVVAFAVSVNEPQRILSRVLGFPEVGVKIFAWVTLVFAALDYWGGKLKLLDNWSPRSLPPVAKPPAPLNRTGLIGETIANTVFVAWWLAVPAYPWLVLGPAASFLAPSPGLERVYVAAAVPTIALVLLGVVILLRPSLTILARLRPLVTHAMTLVGISMLLRGGDLLVPLSDTPRFVRLADGLNQGVTFVLVMISIVTAVLATVEAIRLASRWSE